LTSDSAYNLRKQTPEKYAEQQVVINGIDVSIMTDKANNGDKTAFIMHNGLVADIAMSGGGKDDVASDEAFTLILQTWLWL
jgi:hypothetical protein